MALDPSIIMGARPVQTPNVLGQLQGLFALKGAKQQAEVGEIELKNAQAQQAEQQTLNSLFQKHATQKDGKPGVDQDAVLNDLFTMGRGDLARKYQAQTMKDETDRAAHSKALSEGKISALSLEKEKTARISALARAALDLEGVPEPLRAEGWNRFVQEAKAIDPEDADMIPTAYDPGFLRQVHQMGLTEEQSLDAKIKLAEKQADTDFRAAIPAIEKQIRNAGRDEQRIAAVQRDIALKYPGSKLAKDYVAGLPKSKDPKDPAAGDRADRRTVFEMEAKLGNEFTKKVTPLVEGVTSARQIEDALARNNPLDAYNAIVQFVKLTDPGVSAREGEVSAAGKNIAGGALGRLGANLEKLKSGKITPAMIDNIRASTRGVVAQQQKEYEAHKTSTKKKVDDYNKRGFDLSYDAVVGDYDTNFKGAADNAPPSKLQPGTVVKNGGKSYTVGADGESLTEIK